MAVYSFTGIKEVFTEMRSVFTLSKEEEREYTQKSYEDSILTLRLALALGFVFYALFTIQDCLAFPSALKQIIIIKLIVQLGFVISLALTFTKKYSSYHQWSLFFLILSIVFGQFCTMLVTAEIIGSYQSLYHGMPQAVICAFGLAQLNLRVGWIMTAIIIMGNYYISSFLFNWQSDPGYFGGNMINMAPTAFILSVALLMTIVNITVRYYRRKNFLAQKLIDQEKKETEALLLNILPKETAQELKQFGSASAKEYQQVCILFSDFEQFTKISENLSATELVEELNVCFKAFDQITEKYGVEKIKTIGDAYMCVSGMPDPDKSTASDIINVAIEMMEFIKNRRADRIKMNKMAFDMRIGIHAGPVVAGIVGDKKFQYDIWGDTVNIAARMESNSEAGKINISSKTKELIGEEIQFLYQDRGPIDVKGKGEMEMYFVDKQT